MAKVIVLMATLDTKGREIAYMREIVERRGHSAVVIDTGLMGEPATPADYSNSDVALAGGSSLSVLRDRANREESAPALAAGATVIMKELVAARQVHALVALGGTQGTTLATAVMRELPYGFPKIMVSTMASGNVGPWVGVSDITMMFSVTDIMGLNPFMRRILANAARRRLRHGGGTRSMNTSRRRWSRSPLSASPHRAPCAPLASSRTPATRPSCSMPSEPAARRWRR